MRKVKVKNKKWVIDEKLNKGSWQEYIIGEATFHEFGVGSESGETNFGNYSTAIVEWPDGKVENVPVEDIQFIKSELDHEVSE